MAWEVFVRGGGLCATKVFVSGNYASRLGSSVCPYSMHMDCSKEVCTG